MLLGNCRTVMVATELCEFFFYGFKDRCKGIDGCLLWGMGLAKLNGFFCCHSVVYVSGLFLDCKIGQVAFRFKSRRALQDNYMHHITARSQPYALAYVLVNAQCEASCVSAILPPV